MTTNTKHTPGPWTTVEHSWSRIGIYAGETAIAALDIYERATEDTEDQLSEEMSANGRLMAAAPELIEALRWMLTLHEGTGGEPAGTPDLARAALAKAGVL